jgi:SAM-dependent methyltransferase
MSIEEEFNKLKENPPKGFDVFPHFIVGDINPFHPQNHCQYQKSFISNWLSKIKPEKILDIGSDRSWLCGLLAYYKVTTIDVRKRKCLLDNETVITCDASKLDLPNNHFDVVTSLMCIHHVGLGRYGDTIDYDKDIKMMDEIKRVLKPNGYFLFSIAIHFAPPCICFNGHRIYDYEMIKNRLCSNLKLIDEKFIIATPNKADYVPYEKLTNSLHGWDVYVGCWEK